MISNTDMKKKKSNISSSPVTGCQPPDRSKWWMSSSPPTGPSTLNTTKHRDRQHHQLPQRRFKGLQWRRAAHQLEKSQAKLDAPENGHDHHHDVQEIGQDGGPLVAEEIKHLPLETRHLEDRRGRSFVRGQRAEREKVHIHHRHPGN